MIVYTYYLCHALRLKCIFIIIHFHWLKTFSPRNIRVFVLTYLRFSESVFFALYIDCVVPVKIHTPNGKHFCFRPPQEFPFQRVLFITPPPPPSPGISVIFQLGWVPSGKTVCIKNVVALYHYAKDNFFLR